MSESEVIPIYELLKPFITYGTGGSEKVYREWKKLEAEGQKTENRLGDLKAKIETTEAVQHQRCPR